MLIRRLIDEKRAKICDWISKLDYYSHHREMRARVLSQTGQWFLVRREFTDWIGSDQSSLLWLRGNCMQLYALSSNIELLVTLMPSGNWENKSHVSHHLGIRSSSVVDFIARSCVIEDLLEKPWLDGDDVLAYFYCSRTTSDTRQQDPRAILLSILRQLAAPLPGLPLKSPIISAYEKETARGSQEAHLSVHEIIALLMDLIENHYQNVTLILDALDECDATGRLQLLDAFTRLTYNPKTNVKTLISSRNDPDIETHFSRIPNLSITAIDNADDIAKFVHKEIGQRLLHGRASKQIRERVESDLNSKANGVFRWVALQVDALCDPDRVFSVEDVEYLLQELPKTLEDTYSRILDDLESLPPPSREAMKNFFRLLICAEYPMTVYDVLDALAILSGSQKAALDIASVIKMARGLITVEREYSRFIFAHLSVKESLEKRSEYRGEYAHVVAAEACLKAYLRPVSPPIQFSEFRWYALTHLGRHCLKSGGLRQAPKLRSLMEGFLLTNSYDAFERWNRDCFRTDVETAPGTCRERRNCQSRPGLPLFMVCVYGFDELVERMIEKHNGAFRAENFNGARPLEVAASYGNYDTMVKIWNAASLKDASSVRSEKWLEAAAQSLKFDIWNFVVKHISVIPFKAALVLAARNNVHGNQMVGTLLEYPFDIDEDVIYEVLKSCASLQTLGMILAHFSSTGFTELMMEAAVQNPCINPELTEMILSNHQNLRVSRNCILSAFQFFETSSSSRALMSKAAVIKSLLNSPTRCEISEEMISIVAALGKTEDIECLDLLLQHCSVDHITEDLLVAAAENSREVPAILEFFLNHSLGHTITQQVLQAAISYASDDSETHIGLTSLLSQPACPPVLEESLYIMIEKWGGQGMPLSIIMNECRSMHISDIFLQACAANRSFVDVRHILFLPRAIPISKDVVTASTRNSVQAPNVLKLLLQFKCGFEFEVSEDILLKALSNEVVALKLAHVLAKQWGILPVTEESMMAAVRSSRRGCTVFEYLLQYCESVDKMLTENVLQAAIEGDNLEFVEYFKEKRPDFEVKEEFLQAAVMNRYSTNNAVLRILLSQETRCVISESLLETARMGSQSTLELLLEKVSGSDSPQNPSDLAKKEPSGTESDDKSNFEEVLSAAGREEEFDYVPKISHVELLLSRYCDSALNSTRLIELAAEKRKGKFIVQYLLSRFPKALVTRGALLAAAGNEKAMTSLLGFLLKHSRATIDSELLQAAAANKYRGTQMVQLLLANCPADTKVERVVIIAALRNHYCGRSLLKLLLAREPDLTVAQDIVDAAYENRVLGKILLQMLLKHALTLSSLASADLIFEKMRSTADGLRDSLFIAACDGDEVILNFLISHKVSALSISGELGTALNVAAYAGNANEVEILLKAGSDLESYSRLYGTPLQAACLQGNFDTARILVKKGADIDQPNQMGRTELHTALRQGNHGKIKALISLGASTAKKDHQEMSALHHASLCTKSADCVKLLIGLGVSIDPEDSRHWTPLHWAAKSGAADIVRCLLEAGAAKTKTDLTGKTPFHVAMLSRNLHLRPKLFSSDLLNVDTEHASEVHPGVKCDFCDLVSVFVI